MQCVAKGVPAPVISWMTKVIDIPGTVYADDIKLFARPSTVGMFDKKRAREGKGEKCNTTRMSVCGISRVAEAFDRTISRFNWSGSYVPREVKRAMFSSSSQDGEIPLLDVRPQLRFHADNRNLSGRYTCVATNGIGDPAVAYINLRIRCKSTFVNSNANAISHVFRLSLQFASLIAPSLRISVFVTLTSYRFLHYVCNGMQNRIKYTHDLNCFLIQC